MHNRIKLLRTKKIITRVHQITETSQTYMSHVTAGSGVQCVLAVPEKKA